MAVGDTLHRVRVNWEKGVLDSAILSTDLSLSSSEFASLPDISAPDHLPMVLDKDNAFGVPEIVWVTSHTAGATTLVIERAKEGTSARDHPDHTGWVHGLTAFDMNDTSDVVEAFKGELASFVKLDGSAGPMTGLLVLSGDPSDVLGATPKQYVDGTNLTLSDLLTVSIATAKKEAIAGAKVYSDGLNHFTDAKARSAMGTSTDTNTYRHTKFTAANAKSAMGSKSNTNSWNHDRYSDANALSATGSTYLKLTGGKISGNLEVTGKTEFKGKVWMGTGTDKSPAFLFHPDGAQTGMYAQTTGEISFTMEGTRTFSIVSAAEEARLRGRVIIRASSGVPLKIERHDATALTSILMRFVPRYDSSKEINISVKNLIALSKL